MKNRLHMLILLGMICAGFTYEFQNFEFPIMAVVYGIAGLLALKFRRARPPRLRQVEAVILFVAILIAYQAGRYLGPNRLIFIANALAIYQWFRLFLPMESRPQRYALAVAIIHLAVGALAIVEPERFLPILGLALFLIPAAMTQIDRQAYQPAAAVLPPVRLGRWQWLALVVIMIVFFVAFPRVRGSRQMMNPAMNMTGGGRIDEGVDPDAPGSEGNLRLLFRVSGDELSYLRIDSLDAFDGMSWRASPWAQQRDPGRDLRTTPATDMLFRRVKVFPQNAVGLALPTDYFVIGLNADLRQHIYVADHGGVLTTHSVPANLTYEYWTRKTPPSLDLNSHRDVVRYRALGGYRPSPELQDWLDDLVRGAADPYDEARRIENHFRSADYAYDLGAPQLSEEAPIEDFILRQKKGHCGRYASAVAILLRLRGIPSRVVRGFVPREYNDFGDFYNIRARDLHAWAEGWFPDRGWVAFDGTPDGGGITMIARNPASSFYEWLEDNWYSKVVEFSAEDQNQVINFFSTNANLLGGLAMKNLPVILVGLLFAATVMLLAQFDWRWLWQRRPTSRAEVVREVRHFYGRLLRALAKRHFRRRRQQTPLEFLRSLEQARHPEIEAIRLVTRVFCDVRYGNRELSPDTRTEVDSALARVAASSARGPDR